MPATGHLRGPSRTTVTLAATVPLAVAVADSIRVRRQRDAARRDPLTGLPGRHVLAQRITRLARTHRTQLHVLVADADGLKTINDTLGHSAGDVLLAAIGHRMGAWAQERSGFAVRLGGDEFAAAVLLAPDQAAREICELRDLIGQPVDQAPAPLRPQVSIGVARAADLPDASRMLRGADMAMYRVKAGQQECGYLATVHDAYTPAVHGRRPGRPGTHLPVG